MATTYHPLKKDMVRLVQLHKKLTSCADGKAGGALEPDEASRKAVEAVDAVIGRKIVPSSTGPLVRLHKLCENGWIRQAADEMPVMFPDLEHPERWQSAQNKRRSRR